MGRRGAAGVAELVTEDERSELARLRRENLQLKMERDILKKSHGGFKASTQRDE